MLSTFRKSCSTSNSGVWTPIVTRPCSLYFSAQARIYGAVRSQLTHVNVQKFTRTTCPRRSSGERGSELSHPLAPSSEDMGTISAKRRECRPDLFGKERGLFPGREVAAPVDLVEVGEVGVRILGPAARGPPDLAGEGREAGWD